MFCEVSLVATCRTSCRHPRTRYLIQVERMDGHAWGTTLGLCPYRRGMPSEDNCGSSELLPLELPWVRGDGSGLGAPHHLERTGDGRSDGAGEHAHVVPS